MNADKFFEKYSIEEISKKTKISPISLRFIKNKEYDKIPRVKFIGFIKLIEREFKVDLSELIEEFDTVNKTEKVIQKAPSHQPKTPKKETLLYILIFSILIISGAILYLSTQQKSKIQNQPEINTTQININQNQSQINSSQTNTTKQNVQNNTKHIEKSTKKTVAKSGNIIQNQLKEIKSITIIPNEKVWYRAVNLDTNKTYEYLTTKTHTFPGKNYYIKFGHGNITIEYGDINITPNTKKIVKILLKNGKYEYVKGKK